MAECAFCVSFNPDSTCVAETCLFVKYGIVQKTNEDAAFKAKFQELVTASLSIESVHLRMELMRAVAVGEIAAAAHAAAAADAAVAAAADAVAAAAADAVAAAAADAVAAAAADAVAAAPAEAAAAAAANGTCWEAVQACFGPVIQCFCTCLLGCCLST